MVYASKYGSSTINELMVKDYLGSKMMLQHVNLAIRLLDLYVYNIKFYDAVAYLGLITFEQLTYTYGWERVIEKGSIVREWSIDEYDTDPDPWLNPPILTLKFAIDKSKVSGIWIII